LGDKMPCLPLVIVCAARPNTLRRECRNYVSVVSFAVDTTAVNASSNCAGNSRPRFAARRRIPAQAFALKKYRSGTSPVTKISDNEDTTASLGNSEVLSVQDSVGPPVPEFSQRPKDGAKVPSFVA
jgi:hypothetical protein